MALTRDFKDTVASRVQNDPAFAQALLDEAITLFINGEPETAKLILRDLVNATVGFEALAEEIHKPAKSLHRMLSVSGNPTMTNISAIFAAIKKVLGVEIRTQVIAAGMIPTVALIHSNRNIALEALGDAWNQKRVTMDELWESAEICRMTNVMLPYLESLVGLVGSIDDGWRLN